MQRRVGKWEEEEKTFNILIENLLLLLYPFLSSHATKPTIHFSSPKCFWLSRPKLVLTLL